jgi:hypothetical protein
MDGISGVLDVIMDMIRNNLHEADGNFFDRFFRPAGSLTCVGCVRNAEDLDAPHRILAMLPQLDLRHLYAVIILSEELNFTRAARRLQISQPALSRQILDIEKQHEFQLFIRDRKNPYRASSYSSLQTKLLWFMNCRSVKIRSSPSKPKREAMAISLEDAIAILRKWKDESAHIFVGAESPVRPTSRDHEGGAVRWTMNQHVKVLRVLAPPAIGESNKAIVEFEGPLEL